MYIQCAWNYLPFALILSTKETYVVLDLIQGESMNLKSQFRFFSLYLIGVFVMSASAAGDASKYKIGDWANFAQGAISHTFDDNMNTNPTAPEQAAFNDKKFHITLFVQTGSSPNWNNCKSSFAKGHEIASHSVSHGSPSPSSEFSSSQKTIQQNVPGEKCVSYAYPNCKNPGGATQVFIAARTCESSTPNNKSPSDWGNIQSKGFGSGAGGYPNDANSLNSYANSAASSNGWGVGLHHGIGSQSHNWAVTNLNAMKSHLDYLDQNRDKIWMETFGNVARYIKERNAAQITEKSSSGGSFTIEVKAPNLDTSIFNYPLSIQRELPSGWDETKIKVTQNDIDVPDTVVTDNTKKYIRFKAVPNAGDVVITTTSNTKGRYWGFTTAMTSPVKRLHTDLIIDPRGFNGSSLNVTLFNLQGKELARYSFVGNESRIVLPIDKINRSSFIVKIACKDKGYAGTFLPQL